MLETRRLLLSLLVALTLVACSDDNAAVHDAGVVDARSSDLVAPKDGAPLPDIDPAKAMLVTIPSGAALCSGFAEGRTWQEELALVGQVQLAAPALILPREEGVAKVPHFVGAVEHSPERQRFTPSGKGAQREAEKQRFGWRYVYTMALAGPVQPAALTVTVTIRGEPTSYPASVSLHTASTKEFGISASAELRLGSGATEIVQRYGLCELGAPEETIEASTAGGDKVRLEVGVGPWFESCFAAGETACLFLTRAEVSVGQAKQVITDRFRLIYVGGHHNWNDEYLILLDPPLGATAALLVKEPPLFSGKPGEVRYLDAALKVTKTEALSWKEL